MRTPLLLHIPRQVGILLIEENNVGGRKKRKKMRIFDNAIQETEVEIFWYSACICGYRENLESYKANILGHLRSSLSISLTASLSWLRDSFASSLRLNLLLSSAPFHSPTD